MVFIQAFHRAARLLSFNRAGDAASPEAIAPAREGARILRDGDLLCFASFLFIFPNVIFATALNLWAGAVLWIGGAGAAVIIWRARDRGALLTKPSDLPALALSLGFGVALCVIGGEGHFFYSPPDWLIRDAVLSDLVRNGVAILYRDDGEDYFLRAPLGMYLAPALVGRLFGLYAAHMAMLMQNATIVGVVSYFVTRVAKTHRLAMLLIFLGFSGLDMVPILIAEAIELSRGEPFMPFSHIEWWGEYFSPLRLQYSSMITLLFWVPNHMAPGWWFGLLSLIYVRGGVGLPALLVSFAALLIWSPLAMAGAAPFVGYFALELLPRRLFARDVMIAVACGLCFLPVAFYLTTDAGGVPHEWLVTREGFLPRYLAHVFVEIPQAAITLYAWRRVEPCDRPVLGLAVALLLVLPLYSIGVGNDFVMRASITPLFLLAFAFARIAVLTPRDNGRFASSISTLVILAAATPLLEIKETLVNKSYAISDCNFLTAWKKAEPTPPASYLAHADKMPVWLMPAPLAAPLEREDRKCWADHPLLIDQMK
jgi:hypothetical protein